MTALASFALLAALAAPGGATAPPHAFAAIDGHYQSIRLALLEDSTEGVREHAKAIAKTARELEGNPSAAGAGVTPESLEALRELLPEVVKRAEALASASAIGEEREALKSLTQPLVRWHELVQGPKPRLAYCSMERGAWFQPDGVLGNPYGGTRMPRCGVFVTK